MYPSSSMHCFFGVSKDFSFVATISFVRCSNNSGHYHCLHKASFNFWNHPRLLQLHLIDLVNDYGVSGTASAIHLELMVQIPSYMKIGLNHRLLRSALVSGMISPDDVGYWKEENYCCNLLLLHSFTWGDHRNQSLLSDLNISLIMYNSITRTFRRLASRLLINLAVLMSHFMCSETKLIAVCFSEMNDCVGSYCDRVCFHCILACHRLKHLLYFYPWD